MKALPFTLIAIFSCQTLAAQVSIGHRVGVSLSQWVVKRDVGPTSGIWATRGNLVPGLSVELPVVVVLHGPIRLNTGVAFLQQGYQNIGSSKVQYRNNYVQVPLSLGWAFATHRFSFTPSIGGAYGSNVRGRGRQVILGDKEGSFHYPIGRMEDNGYGLQMPDQQWSLLGRLGIAYAWDRSAITLDLAYQYGLSNAMFAFQFTDINGNPIPDTGDIPIPEARQRSYVFQLGYQLTLGNGRAASKALVPPADSLGNVLPPLHNRPKVMVGTRFGATRSTMTFSASLPEEQARVVDGAQPLLGVSAAVVVRVRLTDQWSLRPELAYMQKGWRCQWYPRPTVENDILRMDYMELPMLVNYQFTGRKFRPYVLAGPVIGRGIGGVQNYHAAGGTETGDFYDASSITFGHEPKQGDYNPWDFSAQAGVGLVWAVGTSELSLDVRYQYGFSDVVSDPNSNLYSTEVEASHRNWMVNIGYLVPWRK